MCQKCRLCGIELDDNNWYLYNKTTNRCICKTCSNAASANWRKNHPEARRRIVERYGRNIGKLPMNENRACSSFLGIHVAERILSKVFKNVKRMSPTNPGFDFICNRDKKIDVKSSTLHTYRNTQRWKFNVRCNKIADYFLCIAFDDREHLNPIHLWLIPGEKINHLHVPSISANVICKWDEYKLDIEKVVKCCEVLR